jgi:hypothetical protein
MSLFFVKKIDLNFRFLKEHNYWLNYKFIDRFQVTQMTFTNKLTPSRSRALKFAMVVNDVLAHIHQFSKYWLLGTFQPKTMKWHAIKYNYQSNYNQSTWNGAGSSIDSSRDCRKFAGISYI